MFYGSVDDIGCIDEFVIFGGDFLDVIMSMILLWIVEVDFFVLNDGVVLVGDIDCFVWFYFYVNWVEGDVLCF